MALNLQNARPLRADLLDMEIGETISFPIARTSVVRSTASILAMEQERKYKTETDRVAKYIRVTRIA